MGALCPLVPRNLPDPFERRDPLACGGFQLLAQCSGVVRHQLGPVARAADFNIEAFLRRQMRVVRLHRGDNIVYGASLKRMYRGRPGMIEMAQLRIGAPEFERAAILKPEGDPATFDR